MQVVQVGRKSGKGSTRAINQQDNLTDEKDFFDYLRDIIDFLTIRERTAGSQ